MVLIYYLGNINSHRVPHLQPSWQIHSLWAILNKQSKITCIYKLLNWYFLPKVIILIKMLWVAPNVATVSTETKKHKPRLQIMLITLFLEKLKIKSTLIHSTVLIHHHWVHRTRLKFNLLFHAFHFSFTKKFLYSNIWNCSRDLFYSEARDVLTDVWNDNIVCGFLVLNQLTWKIQNTGGRTFYG